MKSTLASSLIASLALSALAQADALQTFSPVVAASVHDEPVDGIGDSFNTGIPGLIRTQSTRADRAIHEYDATGLAGQTISAGFFTGRIDANNSFDNGVRTFDFLVYDANGVADLSDYQVSATVVGSGSYHPPMDASFDYFVDATAAIQALLDGGATHIGLRVEGSSSPNFPNVLDVASAYMGIKVGGLSAYSPYCFGDGSGAACPCGNSGAADAGCANGSSAQGASLGASGSFRTTLADNVLSASGLVPGQPGLYYQGDNAINGGAGVPFGDGLRCAGGNVVRLEVAMADASGMSNTTQDLGSIGGVVAGDTKYYQLWYRDPSGTPCGSGFNVTNGISAMWSL